jgi:hypothetical protein
LISIDGAIDGFSYREEEEKKREEGGSVYKCTCIRRPCTKAKEKESAEGESTGARYMHHSLSHLNSS